MQKKLSISAVAVIVAFAIMITFMATYVTMDVLDNPKPADDENLSALAELEAQLQEVYYQYYLGNIDEKALAEYMNTVEDNLAVAYFLASGDKYGSYFNPQQYEDYMNSHAATLSGVGIIYAYTENENGEFYAEIVMIANGSPASVAGLKIGDIITSVNGEAVVIDPEKLTSNQLNNLLGEKDTEVRLGILRNGEALEIVAKIGDYTAQRVISRKIEGTSIGYIYISEFAANTFEQMKAAVEVLKNDGCDRIIFDLRGNPGGEEQSVMNCLDYLLPKATLTTMVDKNGEVIKTHESDESCVDMPFCILVNEQSASAAELFTICMRDIVNAPVVGQKTYGKGTVNLLLKLNNGGMIKVSVYTYNPPKSENFEGKGIVPDYEIALDESVAKFNIYKIINMPENDAQLKKAIEIISAMTTEKN